MSNSSFLNTFNEYSVEEFVQFLKNNGLSEFEKLAVRKHIDGHTFLNLAEFEINNWKPLINSYQAQKFWSFLNHLRNAPMNFIFVAPTKPTPPVPSKPNVEKEKLEKLSQDNQFIVALRAAIKGKVGGSNTAKKSISPARNSVVDEEGPPPPPRPNYKKPVPPVPQYEEPHSSNTEDHEVLYETPDDEGEIITPVVTKQSRPLPIPIIQKPLPEIPINLPTTEPAEEVQVKRTPFQLQQHYTKQRAKEKELEKSGQNFSKIQNNQLEKSGQNFSKIQNNRLEKSGQNFSKIPVQSNPLPTPFKGAVPKPEKLKPPRISPEPEPSELPKFEKSPSPDRRFNSIPRPPKSFPKLEIDDPPSPDLPEIPKPIPAEQENFYRYTDAVGARMLLTSFEDGTYLVRPSKQFHCTLSVKQGDKVYHLGIQKDGNTLQMESMTEGLKFEDLHELINHFKTNPLVVRNKYNQLVDIYLRKTLPEDLT